MPVDPPTKKLHSFLPTKAEKPLNASVLFPLLKKEIEKDESLTRGLRGLFIVTVLKKGILKEEWSVFVYN
jgi:hypothetical protein